MGGRIIKMIRKMRAMVQEKITNLVKLEVQKEMTQMLPVIPQLIDFYKSLPDQRQSFYDHTDKPLENYAYYHSLRDRLIKCGIKVENVEIDIPDFELWLKKYPQIDTKYRSSGDTYIEKCLECYLSYTYLDMSPNDVFIDVAAYKSPYADLLNDTDKIKSYRLDLSYPKGIHGNNIGADAGNTNLPGEFANSLAVHCAYEFFMGDSDINFIREAARILKQKGNFIILPLYLEDKFFNVTSPYCSQTDIIFDSEALKVWRDDSYKIQFSRYYSPEVFFKRIYTIIPENLDGKVYFIQNLPDVMKYYSGQRIYCYFMFYCQKTV
ncbi:MAG: hypothetical protein MRK02_09115 [Candidatus Scalindua sp.]|nr:hypothetical protein [Candidatus Scalindua sp.]